MRGPPSARALRTVAVEDRFGARVHRWAAALEEGDPLADAVADRFAEEPSQLGHFHRMLAAGPGAGGGAGGDGGGGGGAAPELHALFAATSVVPAGVDHAAIARGGRLFFRAGAAGGLALGAGSLVGPGSMRLC